MQLPLDWGWVSASSKRVLWKCIGTLFASEDKVWEIDRQWLWPQLKPKLNWGVTNAKKVTKFWCKALVSQINLAWGNHLGSWKIILWVQAVKIRVKSSDVRMVSSLLMKAAEVVRHLIRLPPGASFSRLLGNLGSTRNLLNEWTCLESPHNPQAAGVRYFWTKIIKPSVFFSCILPSAAAWHYLLMPGSDSGKNLLASGFHYGQKIYVHVYLLLLMFWYLLLSWIAWWSHQNISENNMVRCHANKGKIKKKNVFILILICVLKGLYEKYCQILYGIYNLNDLTSSVLVFNFTV